MKANKNMLAEYDLSGKKGARGKYHKAFRNGYTVRVYDKGKIVSVQYFAAPVGARTARPQDREAI